MSKFLSLASILSISVPQQTLAFQHLSPRISSAPRRISKMSATAPASASASSSEEIVTSNASSNGNLLLSKFESLSINGPQRLILASQSPRRREILDMMGLANRYTVTFSPLDEEALQIELANSKVPISPVEYTKKLAESKAFALAQHMASDSNTEKDSSGGDEAVTTFILGSDTIVDKGGIILEKPKSEQQAVEMLTQLSDSWHEVHTGVAIYKMHQKEMKIELASSFVVTAKVKFTQLSADDIHAYVKTGEPMDKAGSYGIQGIGGQMIECMEGDFFAVMGLPMHRLSRELASALD